MHLNPTRTVARAAAVGGILVLGLGSATAAMAQPASIINVDCTVDSLTYALQNAENGQVLLLPEGCTYKLTSGLVADATITIIGDNDTIRGKTADLGFSLLTVDSGNCVTIDNVNFEKGGGDGLEGGGAILNEGGTVKITGGLYSSNAAEGGGAIFNAGGQLWVTSAYFDNNQASSGGAIFNGGYMKVASTIFSGNGATGGSGGAIDNTTGAPNTIISSSFLGNTAKDGGAIYNCGALEIEGSSLTGNIADYGGGIYNNNGSLLVEGTTIEYNIAYDTGGGIYNCGLGSNICLTNDCIRDNTPNNCAPDDLTGCMNV